MSKPLVLHEITGSPNSLKVRIALGYKGLAYDRKPFEFKEFPGDRSAIVGTSRQPRYPVLLHGETMMFDSSAIVRYLEANFPDTPRLFVEDYAGHAEIEQWEMFAKTQLGECVKMMFNQAFSPEPDRQVIAEANRLLHECTAKIEDALDGKDFLLGDRMTAADVSCGAALYLVDLGEAQAASSPVAAFFRANLRLGENRERTLAWIRRVVAHDSVLGKSPQVA